MTAGRQRDEGIVLKVTQLRPVPALRIADLSSSIEVVVFPKLLTQFKDVLVLDKCVVLRAKTSFRNESPSLVLDSVRELI